VILKQYEFYGFIINLSLIFVFCFKSEFQIVFLEIKTRLLSKSFIFPAMH